ARERPRRKFTPDMLGPPEEGMERYRLEVGHEHAVKPGNIVGAIANEAGIDSKYIGKIEIFDDYSLVELPEGMPAEVFEHLKKVWVANRQLEISRFEAAGDARGKRPAFSKERKPAKSFGKERADGKPAKSFNKERKPGKSFGNERPERKPAKSFDRKGK